MTTEPMSTHTGVPGLVRLYIAGQSPRSLDAFANLKSICDHHLPGQYEIEVVDLVEHPEQATTHDVLALPTLIRIRPLPPRRIIGNLSDTERVLGYLRLPMAVTP